MTIFDSIKYPITEDATASSLSRDLPKPIFRYWYDQHVTDASHWYSALETLKQIILKYDTDECMVPDAWKKPYDDI